MYDNEVRESFSELILDAPDEFDKETAVFNDKLGIYIPLNTTYGEWKENLSQQRNGKTHYKGGE